MRLFRPANLSLMQLVLLGFALVILPLGVLVFQASSAYRELSTQASLTAREAVAFTRRAQSLSSLALDMERTILQYLVVKNPDLLELMTSQQQQLHQLLDQSFVLFPPPPAQEALRQLLETTQDTEGLHLDQVDQLSFLTSDLTNQTHQIVDRQLSALQQAMLSLQQQLARQFLLLSSLSLLLVLFFTWRLLHPISYLRQRILALANPDPRNHLKGVHQGPAELIQLHHQLDWLEQQLAEVEQQKQQFLRHISHELKTPLASIREAGDLLNEEILGTLSAPQKEVTGLLEQNSKRLQQLIEQLLNYNLLQGKRLASFSPVALDTLLSQLLLPWQPLLTQRKQRVELPESGLTLRADPALLRSVLDNLISNAVHYGDPSHPILIRAGQQNRQQWVEVENAGPDIPAAEQTRLFEPFFQGSSRRRGAVKGSGLGLSIAADCMKAQNGTLRLKSSQDNAIVFRLEWVADE